MSPTKLTLFDIEQGLLDLMEAYQEAGAEESAAISEQLTEYVQAEIAKVDGIRSYLRHCDLMASAAKQEAELQTVRAKSWEQRSKALKSFCIYALGAAGKKFVEGRTGKLMVKANGGKRELVITSEGEIPDTYKFQVISYQIDKYLLRHDLENGAEISGAHLEPRGEHLEVK